LFCGSFGVKVDDRLVLQLFCHIARFDVSGCSDEVKDLVGNLSDLAVNGFCRYRGDVDRKKMVKDWESEHGRE
jgi:hypothetical protein